MTMILLSHTFPGLHLRAVRLLLSVPEAQGRGWIPATTCLVVVFSIALQGGTLDLFLKKSGRYRETN